MRARNFLAVLTLALLAGSITGCHELWSDEYRDYSRSGYGSYQDGFRDGRHYERRRENLRESRYDDRGDYYRRRW